MAPLLLVSRVAPGDSLEGMVLLTSVAASAHGLEVVDVMVRFSFSCWDDVVNGPVIAY